MEVNRRTIIQGAGLLGALGAIELTSKPLLPFVSTASAETRATTEDDFVSFMDADGKAFHIYATELALTDEMIPKNAHTFVHADRVAISSELTTRGMNISIFARELAVLDDTAVINTKGPGPLDFALRPPAKSGDYGRPGEDGQPGGDGTKAGDVFIAAGAISGKLLVDASGGNGGRGQNGGKGGDGRVGASGAPPDGNGASGEPGGIGGRAGKPGKGADAGAVTITYLKTSAAPTLQIIQKGGRAGPKAANGSSGAPGPGGPGASGQRCHREWSGD